MRNLPYIIMLFSVILLECCTFNKSKIVAWVEEEPITISELRHWMLLEKANVYNEFYQKHGVSDHEGFWKENLGGEIPLVVLKERALMKARICKTQQILALERGIINTANYDEILAELNAVNSKRENQVSLGKPVYGPVILTARNYFTHQLDEMVSALKVELLKSELSPDMEVFDTPGNIEDTDFEYREGLPTMDYVDQNYESYIRHRLEGMSFGLNKGIYERIDLKIN